MTYEEDFNQTFGNVDELVALVFSKPPGFPNQLQMG